MALGKGPVKPRTCKPALEPHHHDQVGQLVPGPAAQPAHLPIAESGAQLDGRAKAEEFRFQLHGVDSFGSTHSWLWGRAQSSPEPANRHSSAERRPAVRLD